MACARALELVELCAAETGALFELLDERRAGVLFTREADRPPLSDPESRARPLSAPRSDRLIPILLATVMVHVERGVD